MVEVLGLLLVLALLVLVVGGTVLWVISIVDLAKAPDHAFRLANTEKLTWILIVVLVGQIGALIWWFGPRKRVKAAAAAYPAAPASGYGPPPGWYPDPNGGPTPLWWDGQRWSRPQG